MTGYTANPFDDDGRVEIEVGTDLVYPGGGPHLAVINPHQGSVTRFLYDGSALTTCAYGITAPSAMPLKYAFSRGFGVGRQSRRNQVLFSDIASWTVTGFSLIQAFVMGGGSSQKIEAIEPFRSTELVVFMEDRIEVIRVNEANYAAPTIGTPGPSSDPYTNWSREIVDTTIGCGSTKSVAKVGEDIYFVDQHGLVRSLARTALDASQGTRSLPISEPIHSWTNRINPQQFRKIHSAAFERFLFVAFPIDSSGVADHIFRLDVTRTSQLRRPVWDGPWVGDDVNPFSMTVATLPDATLDRDQNATLFVGENTTSSGIVRRMNRTLSGDQSVVYREETKRYSGGSIANEKEPQTIDVFLGAAADVTIAVEANCDARGYRSIGFVNGIGDAPNLPQAMPYTLAGFGVVHSTFSLSELDRCRDVQFRFTATTSGDINFFGYSVRMNVVPYREEVVDG